MKQKVAFICAHNSCRSQIAEALGKKLASDVFESYSAGTEIKPRVNQDAVCLMKQVHGIDMEESQYSKLLSDMSSILIIASNANRIPSLNPSTNDIISFLSPSSDVQSLNFSKISCCACVSVCTSSSSLRVSRFSTCEYARP